MVEGAIAFGGVFDLPKLTNSSAVDTATPSYLISVLFPSFYVELFCYSVDYPN